MQHRKSWAQCARACFAAVAFLLVCGLAWSPVAEAADEYDVVLLPTEDFSYDLARELARILQADTGLRMRAMLNVGIRDWKPVEGGGQYNAGHLREIARPAIESLKKSYGGSLYILLTSRDINHTDSGLRYTFATHFPESRISVVSPARMRFVERGQPAPPALVIERLRKMMLRTIGIQYYDLPRSSDPKDIMFSPVMGVDNLDAMEARWDGELRRKAVAKIASGESQDTARFTELRWTMFNQPAFNPGVAGMLEKSIIEDCGKLWREGKAPAAIARCREALQMFPASVLANHALAEMMQEVMRMPSMNAEQRQAVMLMEAGYRSTAEGLIKSILASGDGKTEASAFRVISVNEEHIVLAARGLRPIEQGLVRRGDRVYDRVRAQSGDGTEAVLFFDVTELTRKAEAGREGVVPRPQGP